MIYLFCNSGYGKPFLAKAVEFSSKHNVAITIVMSVKPEVDAGFYSRISRVIHSFISKVRFRLKTGLDLIITDDVNSAAFCCLIRKGDYGIIAGFNQIFAADTIACFQSLVNFHPSILPYYRGPVPSYWCLINNEEKSGYTLHSVTEKIDDGEILFQEGVEIGDVRDEFCLDAKIAGLAADTFYKYLECIKQKTKLEKVNIDAASIYRTHVKYKSFPK